MENELKVIQENVDYNSLLFGYGNAKLVEEILEAINSIINRNKQLEEKLKQFYEGENFTAKQVKNFQTVRDQYYIHKSKIEDTIQIIKDWKFNDPRLNGPTIDFIVNKLNKLVEEKDNE